MGLLDALRDEDFQRGLLRDLADTGNRGAVAGLLGAPVDASAGVLNAAIMAGGLLGKGLGAWDASEMPMPITKPIGGSEWIGDKLQAAGYVTANRNPLAEGLAAFAVPGAMAKIGAMLPVLELPGMRPPATTWRGTGPAVQQRGGPIYPEGKARLQADLEAGQSSGRYALGDVTQGQAQQLSAASGRPVSGNQVFVDEGALNHLIESRMARDGFTAEEIAKFAQQALERRSKVWRDPAARGHKAALSNDGQRDAVTGRSYSAQMPLYVDEDGLGLVSVIPRGLPSRNNKAPKR